MVCVATKGLKLGASTKRYCVSLVHQDWSSFGTIGSKYGQGYDLDAVRGQLDAFSLT